MKRIFLTAIGLLPFVVAAQTNAAAAQSCFSEPSHADARACLEARLKSSADAMQKAEAMAFAALERWGEEPHYKSQSAAALRASSVAFVRMRATQCEFAASLAAGGNGATDRRLLCEIELNERRSAELRASISSLP